ncbi:hypothetical protein BN1080_00876 [Planococcus massiliensis]|uniref:Uncharacterized protein n=1 Tax=Planococcus massiliensis TaxID=1499687 RepID=A0A098EKY3_9BACL|nr:MULTISPECIES: hypothetical protein [Planococcus]MCJ1908204.1 hypothetical protein [Planococcus ruber]CEG21956.1 hypothetical protein BN1080_00876 [Planococcus massiliensis]
MPKNVQLQLEVHMEQLIKLTALLHRRLAEAERELGELKESIRSVQQG